LAALSGLLGLWIMILARWFLEADNLWFFSYRAFEMSVGFLAVCFVFTITYAILIDFIKKEDKS